MKKNIVVLTGAGISADSGLVTFRNSDGLWANHRVEDICTTEALYRNRSLVIEFYNHRRKEMMEAQPNPAHYALVDLEKEYNVTVITQNVDNLHERAGSTNIVHLHGELTKLCSSKDTSKTINIDGWQQDLQAKHADGSLLRPFIVFFGEAVPNMDVAAEITRKADILIIIGTSLNVYPAASLVHFVENSVPIYIVDPALNDKDSVLQYPNVSNAIFPYPYRASVGVPLLVNNLLNK